MKKFVIIVVILLVAAVAFVPIPSSGNGATKVYSALTYKLVKWDEFSGGTKLHGTKVYFLPDNFKSMEQLLEEEAGKLLETKSDDTKTADTTADDTTTDDTTADATLAPYDGEWIEKSEYTTVDAIDFSDIVIKEVYSDCFIATPIIPLPIEYKINWEYTGEWCVGDRVSCVCENCYCDGERYEGDLVSIEPSDFEPDPDVAYKPVIYLYPEEETEVSVSLGASVNLTCAYPEYSDGWRVTASPDGTLTDDGVTYNYLYWEGECEIGYDFSQGFCVRGCDTAAFLEKALADAGLTRREANEFIVYWLPLMQDNEYKVISFQGAPYTEAAPLDVTPSPDTSIRVFMAWYASDTEVEIEPQTLSAPARDGFTLVEWGGTEIVK